ncbi:MAG: M18 family aminopeptidase [Acidimicrobiales bacterium]
MSVHSAADRLAEFIDASPTPHHAVESARRMLAEAGFAERDPTEPWSGAEESAQTGAEPSFVVRDGSLVAWAGATAADAPLRIIGAHTDSPNLRIRPRPDTGLAGFRQLGVEVYGGALVNSWLDRDLGLAGRVAVRAGAGSVRHELFRTDRAVLRVPQLAIHLDRDITTTGLLLNKQQHLTPVWGLGDPAPGDFRAWLAGEVGVDPAEVLSWDAACFDVQPSAPLGDEMELLAAPRLDDLCSCWGAVRALIHATAESNASSHASVVVLNDHEEVGSTTATGAAGDWLAQVLERRALALGGDRSDLLRSLATSHLLSADMAHGTHPNYPERHEPNHWIRLGGGPVIKHNPNARYATDDTGAALFVLACEAAGVPYQQYSHRGDLACGSTIGPITAAALAVNTVDVGMAQLSMHSSRELMATSDVDAMERSFTSWFTTAH